MRRVISLSALVAVIVGSAFWFERAGPVVKVDPPRPAPPPVARESSEVFPWHGVTTLTDAQGQTLTWTVEHVDGEVRIGGVHPRWKVEHRAKADGTPISTVKTVGDAVIRITYSADGARVQHTGADGNTSDVTVTEKNLWDGETLEARLAGVEWASAKRLRLRIVDVTLADGTVYPLVAQYVGEESCAGTPCIHVHVELDDFRRVVAPAFEYWFGTGPDARYLRYDGEGLSFTAR
jgi:hypothetical protein